MECIHDREWFSDAVLETLEINGKLGNNYICVTIFIKINAQIETELGKTSRLSSVTHDNQRAFSCRAVCAGVGASSKNSSTVLAEVRP